jgi:hypothetical protein
MPTPSLCSEWQVSLHVPFTSAGDKVRGCLDAFPRVSLEASVHPITHGVARIMLTITPQFAWRVRRGEGGSRQAGTAGASG